MKISRLFYLTFFISILGIFNTNAQIKNGISATALIKQLQSTKANRNKSYIDISKNNEKGEQFYFQETENNLPPELNKKYPGIKMYKGKSVDNSDNSVIITVVGNNITGFMEKEGNYSSFMNKGNSDLVVFDEDSDIKKFCSSELNSSNNKKSNALVSKSSANMALSSYSHGSTYRTFRFAMIISYQQMQSFGYTTTEQGLGAVNTRIATMNDVFGKEVAAYFTVVPDEDKIIFLNSSDPYPEYAYDQEGQNSFPINATVLNNNIGNSNYDWGMLIHPTNTGWAMVGMCNSYKHAGIASSNIPLMLHELGHMFGGEHSYGYEGSLNIPAITRGIVGSNGAVWFHGSNWEKAAYNMDNWSCGTSAPSGNTPPTITSHTPDGLYIPKGTPFVLTGQATDPDASASLSYNWNHMNVTSIDETNPNDSGQLMWTWSDPSATANNQYIPSLQSLIDNTPDSGSYLANTSTQVKARFIVRDNQLPYGGGAYQDITFNVDDTAGPFLVSYPNTAMSFTGGQNVTVTWDVANTTNALINTQNVNILLSTDRAATWTTLASNIPNNGSYTITLPDITSSKCRIKVEAVNNIFFDISNVDFSVTASTTKDFSFSKINDYKTVLNETDTDYTFNLTKLGTFSNNVDITYSGVPAGATMVATSPITASGDFTVQLTNANAVAPGKYAITVKLIEIGGSGLSKSQTITFVKKKTGDGTPNKSMNVKLDFSEYVGAKATVRDITTNNFSMSLWFKPVASLYNSNKVPSYTPFTSNQQYHEPVLAFDYNASINVNDKGMIGFSLKNIGNVLTTVPVVRNAWNHLAITVSPTQIVLYLNGNPIKINNRRVLPIALGTSLYIGRGKDWFKQNSGEYDEIKIFDKALSAIEVQETMHRNDDFDNPNLIQYYQFNETTNTAPSISPVSFDSCAFLNTGGTITSRITATEPSGAASVSTLPKSSTLTSFGSTDVSLKFTSDNLSETATVHKINVDPYNPDTSGIGSSEIATHANSYWEINAYPNNTTNAISVAQFTVPYDIKDTDDASKFKLYTRNQTSDEQWIFHSSASSIDNANNIITFNNLPQNGQYVIYKIDTSLGTNNPNTENQIKIYPNPIKSGEILTIKGLKGKNTITMYDVSGRISLKKEINGQEITIPDNILSGIYILNISGEENSKTKIKLIVK